MKKRIWIPSLLIAILLNLFPFLQLDVYAQSHEVTIRAEGKEKTLYQRTVPVTDVYCIDYLKDIDPEIGIDDSWDSPFITKLFGEAPNGSNSWMYYFVKDGVIHTDKTVDTFRLSDADEIVFYVSDYTANNNGGAFIPTIDVEKNGETVTLSVYGQNWNVSGPCTNIPITISYIGSKHTDEDGKCQFNIRGIHKVQIGDYPELVRKTIYISDDVTLQKVENAIRDVKNYYDSLSTWSAWIAPSYYGISTTNKEFLYIHKKYKNHVDENADVNDYALHIIGLLAAGKNPRNIDGKDYVQILTEMQKADGKFLKNEGDPFFVTYQSFAVLALDLAGANYDKEKAIQCILAAQNPDGSFGDWGTDGTAMTLFALANHQSKPGVQSAIDKALVNIKNQQAETGGFTSFGSESAETTAMVMKALIALNINPLSDEWLSSTGKNMLDALLAYKQGGQFIAAWSGKPNDMTTEQAFSALVDLYKAESIYQNESLKTHYRYAPQDKTGSDYDFEFIRRDEGNIKKGEEAKIDLIVTNHSDKEQQATCILALYQIDADRRTLYTYTFVSKAIPAESSEDITAGFLVPDSGNYEIKAFLWDDFEQKQPLADPINIPLQ